MKLLVLADRVRSFEGEKRLLLRKMDRSRRAMNPSYFNPDGTVKSIRNKEWQKSKHYLSYQGKLREIYRKQAAVRKYQHECLANEIVAMGDKIYVETMNFLDLAKRKKTLLLMNEPTVSIKRNASASLLPTDCRLCC